MTDLDLDTVEPNIDAPDGGLGECGARLGHVCARHGLRDLSTHRAGDWRGRPDHTHRLKCVGIDAEVRQLRKHPRAGRVDTIECGCPIAQRFNARRIDG